MMNIRVSKHKKSLHIAHQSDVLMLRKEIAELKQSIIELQSIKSLELNDTNANKIKVQTCNGYKYIDQSLILYCQAQGNYCQLHVLEPNSIVTYLISKTLKHFSQQLSNSLFIRTHQSYLINRNEVEGYFNENGLRIRLANDCTVPVSRRLRKTVFETLFDR